MSLLPVADAEEFFRSMLVPRLEDPLAGYVTSVLTDFVQGSLSSEPLCLRLMGDMSVARVLILKEVGDESLFVSGFLGRKDPPASYYLRIGAMAYGELSARTRDPLFKRLAQSFAGIQSALGEVRRDCALHGMDPRTLLEEWLRTRSVASERRLSGLGLFVG